ncbi:outer membrane lipoprotein carrier protein LolA [Rickettsiales bacterium]|nr:outer membrane lipoprotein carrier protein LolA [Rickettsiales bacterium]
MEEIRKILSISIFFFLISSFKYNENDLKKISDFFNSFNTISADFIQLSSDGEKKTGILKIKKPNKAKIEYLSPSNILLISDGLKLAVINKKLESISIYKKDELPLDLFLNNNSFMNKENIVNYFDKENIIEIELSLNDLKNQRNVVFFFEKKPLQLKKWIIKEVNGSETVMYLNNIIFNEEISKREFTITDPRKIPFGRKE